MKFRGRSFIVLCLAALFFCFACKGQEMDSLVSDLTAALPSKKKVDHVLAEYKKRKVLSFGSMYERVNFVGLNSTMVFITKFRGKRDDLVKRWYKGWNEDTTWYYSRFRENEWVLQFYANDDSIMYFLLEEYTKNEKFAQCKLIFSSDVDWAKAYTDSFNARMGTSFSYHESFMDSQYDIYGIRWGLDLIISDYPHKPMAQIYKMVKEKNIELARRFCLADCNEVKCYGATALILLQQEGYPLEAKDERLLRKLRRSKQRIQFGMGGCIIEPARMSFALSGDFLKYVEANYKEYKKRL